MKSFAVLALVGAVAAMPQPSAVTSAIAPSGTIPASCSTNYAGEFEISVVNASTVAKRGLKARTALELTLKNGILTDSDGRTGYIASNDQFQFDNPVQAGAIYTAGWSVCSNGTLALGSSAIFYECLSGTFYNLYDESTGAQCTPIFIDVIPVSGSSSSSTATGAVTQITDGQIQAATSTAVVVTQISDGQIQAATSTAAVVTQISDGQIQATVSTTAATTAAVVTQISDGQIQAATSTANVVSQISDGQIQASATNGTRTTSATPSASTYTGGAATLGSGMFAAAAGVVAYALL